MKWQLSITKADNGYVLEYQEEVEGGMMDRVEVVEDEDNELETMRELLYKVKEHFGVSYNKHDKENLMIEIQKRKEDD